MRIDRFALETDLEIQRRPRRSAGVADLRDRLAGLHPVAGFLRERLVVPIQAHVTAAVVDDHEQPQSGQPVRERDATVIDRPHRRPRLRFEQHAVPFDDAAGTRLAEVAGQATLHRPRELALERGEAWVDRPRRTDPP